MFVSKRLWIAASAAAAAAFLGVLMGMSVLLSLLFVNAMLLVLVVFDVLAAPSPMSLQIGRQVAEVVTMGEQTPSTLTVRNPTQRLLEVEVRDVLAPWANNYPVSHHELIPPLAQTPIEATITPERRGFLEMGDLAVRTYGPVGLAGKQGRHKEPFRIKVYPPLPGRREATQRLDHARALESGLRSSSARGGRSEFDSLREYHPDDDFRAINWRATARAGKAISNLYREDRNQQVVILIDAGRTMAASVGEIPRFDHAIDAAVSVAELAAHLGDHVGVVVFGPRIRALLGPKSGRGQPRRILDMLFNVQPSLHAADYHGAFSSTLSRYRRRALLILMTDLSEESAMEPLFTALPQLVKRHLVILASVRDPELSANAGMIPSSSEEVFLKAAAADLLGERRSAAERLSSMGVRVVDAAAGKLAPAVADTYLSVKTLGQL